MEDGDKECYNVLVSRRLLNSKGYPLKYLRAIRKMRKIIRGMRIKNPIRSLFSPVRLGIIAATYGEPHRWWFLSELASFIGKTPSSLQRELKSLAISGILRTKRDGNRIYFQAETDSPIFGPLRDLVEQTVGVVKGLRDALKPLTSMIDIAFIYGSVAKSEDRVLSDVDVIVVGRAGLSDLSPAIRPLEKKIGREINVSCYSTTEFESKIKGGNHFLMSILNEQKKFLIGGEHELDKLVGGPNGTKP